MQVAMTGWWPSSSSNAFMDSQQAEDFAARWTAAQPAIAAFVHSLVPDLTSAEEVLQRVAVALVRRYDRYDQSRPFVAWAIGVAKFEVLYYRRQQATDKHIFDDELVENVAESYQELVEKFNPMRDALSRCLDEVDGRSRKVLQLRYTDGMTTPGIANEMKISAGAVRILLWRVRRALRLCMEKQVGAPSTK
jgi:RNA polymerase sigma-70 factor (ECF subfamily)